MCIKQLTVFLFSKRDWLALGTFCLTAFWTRCCYSGYKHRKETPNCNFE